HELVERLVPSGAVLSDQPQIALRAKLLLDPELLALNLFHHQ
ncbi:MAG: hypothetical protein QOJ39_3887, partial [Candidatus Eremiobacteraeota bacterium]|nr:hypothetical protein [Candidatus Eremiobacteraeota bacterium]